MTLLEISDLSVEYRTKKSTVHAVNEVSFSVEKGERFGLVGESGCGKSTIAKAITQLLPKNGHITNGSITYDNSEIRTDLTTVDSKTLSEIRWEHLALISQSAMNALDPVYTVGEQIVEAIQLHEDSSTSAARNRARELLNQVGIDANRIDSYPHQLSGGMRQRAMIAMAMALDPALILADEPTTALDVITQDHILDQIDELTDRMGNSLLMITHDISVVAETCNRVGVMYAGELVEVGPTEKVFVEPQHPYTQGLLNSFPSIEEQESELISIGGAPPSLEGSPTQCSFYDRCPYGKPQCTESNPMLTPRGENHRAACFVTDNSYDIQQNYERVLKESEKWQEL